MYNILLDRLPDSYNGYLIRTSFRVGMQISMCLQDETLPDSDKIIVALNLLYGKGAPSIEEGIEGLEWFMCCGNVKKNKKPSTEKQSMFFDFDNGRIYSSFKQTYGIDLAKSDMHWFEFIQLLGSLNKDSALSTAVEIRRYDMSNLKGKHRKQIQDMKENLTPEVSYNEDEQDAIDAFFAQLGGDVNGE